jgi:hypothetical protein
MHCGVVCVWVYICFSRGIPPHPKIRAGPITPRVEKTYPHVRTFHVLLSPPTNMLQIFVTLSQLDCYAKLDFCYAICYAKSMKKCLYCEKEVSGIRKTKKFCSPKCRVYYHRLRPGVLSLNGVDEATTIDLTSGARPGPKVKFITEVTGKTYQFCKHDAVKGFCKKGCK